MKDCPKTVVGGEAWEMLLATERAAKGSYPITGGWYDGQTAALMRAIDFVEGERNAIELGRLKK